jgi:hypothetical protein
VRSTLAPSYAGLLRRIEPVLKCSLLMAQMHMLKILERVARERSMILRTTTVDNGD